jgi:His-Xaa-Ser system radical SAM maturase HxsC
MRCFQGKPVNIKGSLLGKIAKGKSKRWLSKQKDPIIYTTATPKDKLPDATGYILSDLDKEVAKIKVPFIYGLSKDNIDELNEGDIALLDKDGKISILYEINSHQNAIFATNRCNLNCIMCPQPPAMNEIIRLEDNLSLIKMMNSDKTTNLAITGGEPTLLNEGFLELVKACKEYLPKTSLIILTNGKKFKEIEFTRSFTLIGHPNVTVAIPIYSDDDQTHDRIVGVSGSFYEVIKGLYNLALFRQRVEIRTVIHVLNFERLPNLAEFIYHNLPFVAHIAFMGLEVTGQAQKNVDLLWIDPYEYEPQLELASKYLNRYNMQFSIYNHQLCLLPQKLWRFCRKSISTWKNIYLEVCQSCSVKSFCGGFFETSGTYYSKHIRPITC